MRVADNHKAGVMFTPPQQYPQQQLQQPTSPSSHPNFHPHRPSNLNTPVRAHHHPPAVHQMHSSNGDAYTYNRNQQQYQGNSTHQNNQQIYSPDMQQSPQNYMDNGPLPGGRQPLYANAPPKPRRLNSASGVDDDMTSPDARQAGDADNTDDDGGFRDHRRGSHRTNPVMATATYHQPRGANQANIVDEPGNVFNSAVDGGLNRQQMMNIQHGHPQHRQRYIL